MARFRSKPRVIDAEQYLGPESLPVHGVLPGFPDSADYVVTIHGQPTPVAHGDWVLPEPDGEHFYPVKPDIFEATYEPLEFRCDRCDQPFATRQARGGHLKMHYADERRAGRST